MYKVTWSNGEVLETDNMHYVFNAILEFSKGDKVTIEYLGLC